MPDRNADALASQRPAAADPFALMIPRDGGGGVMGAMLRGANWSAHPLGPPDRWPQSLRTAVGICMNSRFPMFVWWGRELFNLYNDAYIPVLGRRHPAAFARPARQVWGEIWPVVGPQADAVMQRGEATWNDRVLLVMERNGYPEDTWFTWSYSPIPDDAGRVGGLFCACTEETPRVLAERERDRFETQLRDSEQRFRVMADTAPAMLWITDATGNCTFLSRGWYEYTGQAEHEGLGLGWVNAVHPDDRENTRGGFLNASRQRVAYSVDCRLRRADGEYRWAIDAGRPRFGPGGEFLGLIGSVIDIDDRKRAEAELRDARDVAEAANAAKDRFLAVLSHELRTPLSPVVMAVAAMEVDPELPLRLREDVAMVRRNIDLETKLIDDLLDLSRVTSGKLRLHMQDAGVHEILRHVLETCEADVRGKGLKVVTDFRAAHDRISGDAARVQQAFWNLVKNAVKFTPAGGTLTIRTSSNEARICVEVADTGIGMPQDVVPRVFDAFEQGDPRMTRQFGGLGLGLAITKAVVDMHGGTVTAASDGPGRGSTFAVDLPLLREATARAHPATPGRNGAADGRPPARVLLVEDHPDTARTLARLLTLSGYSVQTAGSVASALELAARETFDLLISDIGLPDATGYQLMEIIRERYPITGIALSGYGMEEDMQRSREAGFADHIVKPVNVAHLETVLRRLTDLATNA